MSVSECVDARTLLVYMCLSVSVLMAVSDCVSVWQSAGHEVVSYLQHVCSNDVDKAVGCIVHTGMQNDHGGYENDCSLIRLAHNR